MLDVEVAREQMAEERSKLEELQIVQALAQPKELPALPAIAVRVMQITSDPKAKLPDLKRMIETDEALASKVLKFSNSALYGRAGRVSTLTAAITALGFLTVRWLAVTASAHTLFRKSGGGDPDHAGLWEHSLKCATTSRILAKRIGTGQDIEEAFVAGLLHDIGKLAILDKLPGYISRFCQWCEALSVEFSQVEVDVIGVDHSEVSGHVFELWNMPPSLSDAVSHHHSPEMARVNRSMAEILWTANEFFPMEGCGHPSPTDEELATLPLMLKHNMNERDVAAIKEETMTRYSELSDLLR